MRNHFGIRSLFSSLTAKPMRRFGKRGQSVKAESLESRMLLTATLEGFVWDDLNNNGIQDDGATGQGPAGREAFVQVEEGVPGRGLRHRHRR